ncbi:glycine betaine ABC transporter substrate-binding protein [Salibacterium halotolerans]|uniref:Glycine betaine/proline transport system substrate-binding protein n=1 Tax=Salibacterium halotolerans TaxID=1884432 RepID=A0A1I5USR9_9BACI|nr:glycine betaine ABC transporter substrate-binding protein [Salibacterium halotolerans]SFP98218.1 glycine betaine/proline transport system substrate-binding protein [Salibacterium halotolerans]
MRKLTLHSVIAALLLTGLTACGSGSSNDQSGSSESGNDSSSEAGSDSSSEAGSGTETLQMGQINWAENIAVTNMWKVILENRGYDVKLNNLNMGTTMKSVSEGSLDISLEIWLPVQDQNYVEQYGDQINFSDEVWYENAKVGLVVPEYMEDINSIKDLNDNVSKFEGEIVGFDPGAGTMEVTGEMINKYNLDYELLPSSEPAMLEEIDQAIANENPIVAPLWKPHGVFSKHNLKFLDDPKNVYGKTEQIHHATRQGFAEDYPKLDQWFKNWKMTDDQIGTLMTAVNEAEQPINGAETWVENHQELISEWVEK